LKRRERLEEGVKARIKGKNRSIYRLRFAKSPVEIGDVVVAANHGHGSIRQKRERVRKGNIRTYDSGRELANQ
jgi:hypothetical protein